MALEFDESKHEYKRDGVILPSVTQIISILHDFNGIPTQNLEYARGRGLAVHKAIEIFNLGKEFAEPLDPVIVPYLDAWEKFISETGMEITATEQHLDHPRLHYAGTFDARGHKGREKWLLDVKAVNVLSRATGVQLAAYEQLTGEVLRRAAVQVKPDGTYVFQEYDSRSDWPIFVSCLTIYNFRNNHK